MTEVRKNPADRLIVWATAGILVGIGLSATGNPSFGGVLTTVALVGMAYALHRLGRSG
ncbi:MAG: hypothetical protein HY898_07270 [Deltaproteobacteria bacterium]|nr:hypothetical protein [Deltaproteobacteria bacterium]